MCGLGSLQRIGLEGSPVGEGHSLGLDCVYLKSCCLEDCHCGLGRNTATALAEISHWIFNLQTMSGFQAREYS